MNRFFLIPLIVLCLLLALPVGVLAGYRVNPDKIDIGVNPGNNELQAVTITNETDKAQDFKVIMAGFGQSLSGSTLVLDEDNNPLSARNYVRFSPSEFHLEAGQKQEIALSAQIPAGTNGGRYGVLLVVTDPKNTAGVSSITRLGIPMLLTVSNSDLLKTVKATPVSNIVVEAGKVIPLKVIVANEGNIHFRVKSTFVISNEQNQIVGRAYGSLAAVLPGYSREFTAEWVPESTLPKGIYRYEADIYYEDGTAIDKVKSTFEIGGEYVPPPAPASTVIKPASASTLKTNDGQISIDFPEGAVQGDGQISLRILSADQLPSSPAGYTSGATVFRVDGLNGLLTKNAAVHVKYSTSDLDKAGGDASRFVLARWDEAASTWTLLKTDIDKNTQTLSAQSNQFSILAILISPSAAASAPEGLNWLIIGPIVLLAAVTALYFVFFRPKKSKK